jgi:hypothetical protein
VESVERTAGPERLGTFYQWWCLKEAALKSIGGGLPFGLEAFVLELNPSLRVVDAPLEHGGPAQFNGFEIEGTGGCAALVTRSNS